MQRNGRNSIHSPLEFRILLDNSTKFSFSVICLLSSSSRHCLSLDSSVGMITLSRIVRMELFWKNRKSESDGERETFISFSLFPFVSFIFSLSSSRVLPNSSLWVGECVQCVLISFRRGEKRTRLDSTRQNVISFFLSLSRFSLLSPSFHRLLSFPPS